MRSNLRSIILIIMTLSTLTICSAVAQDTIPDCDSLKGAGDIYGLPPMSHMDKIFDCSGVSPFINDLDPLDKTILFIRAHVRSLDELKNATTETKPPKKYGSFIPLENLKRLKKLVDDYYSNETHTKK